MKIKTAHEQLRGLTLPQSNRLKQYHTSLSTDKDVVLFDDNIEELLYEVGINNKWVQKKLNKLRNIGFTQAQYQYQHIEEALGRFQEPNHANFSWNKNWKQAKEKLTNEFSKLKLRTLVYDSKESITDAVPKLNTHAGFSFILTGKRTKGEYVEDLLQNYKQKESLAREKGTFNCPILIGTRTQAKNFAEGDRLTGTFDVTSRLTAMVDVYQILGESKFARPIQQRLAYEEWFAGGKDDSAISGRLSQWRDMYDHVLTIDYSKYDQSVSDWLIRECFDVLREAFRFDPNFDEELFVILREDLISKIYINGHGECVQSNKGIPSGSMFTQIIGSVLNRLIVDTYMISQSISDYKMMIMGDDNIIFTGSELDITHLASYVSSNFGITVSSSKCYTGLTIDAPEFLSRNWTYSGVWRNPLILIAKLCYPESFRDYKYADPLMILYAYILTFPKGMEEIVDISEVERRISSNLITADDRSRWLSGLMRYRMEYL